MEQLSHSPILLFVILRQAAHSNRRGASKKRKLEASELQPRQGESTHLAAPHDDIEPALPLNEREHALVRYSHLCRCRRPVPVALRAWIHIGDTRKGIAELVAIDEGEFLRNRQMVARLSRRSVD